MSLPSHAPKLSGVTTTSSARVAAPVAYGGSSVSRPNPQSITVLRRIPIGNLIHHGAAGAESMTTISGHNTFLVNPGNTAFVHWGAGIASHYSGGRFLDLTLDIETTLGSGTAGKIYVGKRERASTIPSTDLQDFREYFHLKTSAWVDASARFPLKQKWVPIVDTNTATYAFPSGAVYDANENTDGYIQLFDTVNVADGTVIGTLYATYRFELRNPVPAPSAASTFGVSQWAITASGEILGTDATRTVAANTLGLVASGASNVTTITGLVNGASYMMAYYGAGTFTAGDSAGTITSGSAGWTTGGTFSRSTTTASLGGTFVASSDTLVFTLSGMGTVTGTWEITRFA